MVRVADPDPHAIGDPHHLPRHRPAIELHLLRLEADPHLAPPPAPVAGRKVALDAMADVTAFDTDTDRFGDIERAVALDRHVAEEVEDPLVGARRRREHGRDCRRKREQQDAQPHQEAAPKRTWGAAWIDASSSA
jgi:hypothetical protein